MEMLTMGTPDMSRLQSPKGSDWRLTPSTQTRHFYLARTRHLYLATTFRLRIIIVM
jgi:hypothetical protein